MKSFVNSILFASVLAVTASSSVFAQANNSGFEQWYRAKYGRPSTSAQARPNVASQTPQRVAAGSANAGFEQWYTAKYGRPSPTQQARLDRMPVVVAAPAMMPMVTVSLTEPAPTPTLGKSQLNMLIATAKTPAEHERIAEDYQSQAQNYLAQANAHAAMVTMYRTNPNVNAKNQAATIHHCEYFAAKFTGLAAKSQQLAQMHEQMATEATKN